MRFCKDKSELLTGYNNRRFYLKFDTSQCKTFVSFQIRNNLQQLNQDAKIPVIDNSEFCVSNAVFLTSVTLATGKERKA